MDYLYSTLKKISASVRQIRVISALFGKWNELESLMLNSRKNKSIKMSLKIERLSFNFQA